MATTRSPPARMSLGCSSNGRRMLIPMARSGPAPSAPACMIPGPAPVITNQPASARCWARRRACVVERVVGAGAGGAEDRDLRRALERLEHGEGRPHLLEGGGGDLEVEAVGAVAGQPGRGAQDVAQHVAVGGGAGGLEELLHEVVGHGTVSLARVARVPCPPWPPASAAAPPTPTTPAARACRRAGRSSRPPRGVGRLCLGCTRDARARHRGQARRGLVGVSSTGGSAASER